MHYFPLLSAALRLVGGPVTKGLSVLQFLFQLPLLVADVSHLCGLNLPWQRRSLPSPRGTSFIHVSDLFLLPWPPRIHIAFIRVVEGEEGGGDGGGGVRMPHCGSRGATVEITNSFPADVSVLWFLMGGEASTKQQQTPTNEPQVSWPDLRGGTSCAHHTGRLTKLTLTATLTGKRTP